jgi:hypothetical protein
MIKILLIHPGHGHSTADVFLGMQAGLTMQPDVEVVPLAWHKMLRPLTRFVNDVIDAKALPDTDGERLHRFMSYLASGDVIGVAVEEMVDAVIVVNGLLFPPSRAKVLQRLGIPVVCYGTESPYFDSAERDIAPFYTHWFTNERTSVARFADLTRAFYLPHAYNPMLHVPGEIDPAKACDVVFVGGGFPERKQTLAGVDWTDIDERIHGTLWDLDIAQERGQRGFSRGDRYTIGAIPNEETCAWHRSAKIALNMHRSMTYVEQNTPLPAGVCESLGPRAYEIPACGGFMLCDDERPELCDVYGETAATFRAWNSASLEREIRYWLTHDSARERMRAAQAEAVRPHHWGARARTILETIMN